LWRYATALMLYGVHDVMRGRSTGYAKIMPPSRWKQMSVAKKQKTIREQLLSDLGSSMHMSASTVRNLYLCPVSLLAKQFPGRFARTYDLDVDKLEILIHDPARAKSVIKEIEQEKKQIEKELKKKKEEEGKVKKSRSVKKETEPERGEISSIESFTGTDQAISSQEDTRDIAQKDKKSSQATLFSF
ncbi:MAG TPA: replication factor C large subunit, partial [Methanospirillum sp.]|nr:replication factor C large subunit [Methanospirillum sp.]